MIAVTLHGSIIEMALNRPEAYNSFELSLLTELADQLGRAAKDESIRGVVITGRGKAFCAGGDLKWVREYGAHPGAAFHVLAAQFHRAITEIRRMEKPVVAAVNGVAAGGGFSLALACDFRVMELSAKMRQAYTSNGLCIDGGGSFVLPRLLGLAKALEIAAFDEPIDAEQALELGLVTKIVEDGASVEAAIEMARRVTGGAVHAFGRVKRLLTDSCNNTLEFQLERERESLAACADHPEGREGIAAFAEKRRPEF